MKQIPLREGWLMASDRDVLGGDPAGRDCNPRCWLPVEVPTTVQAAMLAHGRAPYPWRDFNAKAYKAFEQGTWWFRREFTLPEDAAGYDAWELRFEGVSLFGMAWVNGEPVGFMHNAHHAHAVDITPYVNASGPNVLALACALNLDQIKQSVRPEIRAMPDCIRAFMRMPQMSSGWDFAPHMLLVGPWRPVTLVGHRKASIEDAFVQTDAIRADSADITVAVKLRQFGCHAQPPKLHLAIHEDPESPPLWSDAVDVCGDGSVSLAVKLPKPRLWYPSPIGEPFLYTLKATVACDGHQVDEHTRPFGVRTVELLQDGEFTFAINGRKVFAKGANWVPPNTLTWDATPETHRHLIELAAAANFNMFRIWGGGIYESDTFYDLCDKHGIMVWQDFMFSNTRVPDDDPVFMERITREVRAAVTRLRRHPSIVLWCGNNECLEAWNVGEWPEEADRHFGERVYYSVLPQTVRQLSPGIPYWPGSPCGGSNTRSLEVGDFHDWYSLPNWRTYDDNAPRFSSEYGCRAVPQRETVDAMVSPGYQWVKNGPQHTVWQFHHGWCGALNQMLPEFGNPATLDEYIELTQELQATLISYAVEVYRRRMFATSGSLIWQYNEPWPAVTFSMVDFFGRPKASYYWVRRACAPIMGMFYAKEGNVSFWGVNDYDDERDYTLRLSRLDHSGTLLGDASFDGVLAPNAATELVETLPEALHIAVPEDEFLNAELRCGETVHERVYHSAFRKDWRLPQTDLSATRQRVDTGTTRVILESPGYVHFAGLTVQDPYARFSDNFVDLLPGEPRTIDIRTRDAGIITIRAANAEPMQLRPE